MADFVDIENDTVCSSLNFKVVHYYSYNQFFQSSLFMTGSIIEVKLLQFHGVSSAQISILHKTSTTNDSLLK